MPTIKFLLKGKKNPSTIYVRIRHGRDVDVNCKTKFLINPSNWSKSKGQPMLRDEATKKLNTDLEILRSKIVKRLNECAPDEEINLKWVKEIIFPTIAVSVRSLPHDLISYFDVYIDDKKGTATPNTIKKANVVKQMLVRMQEELGEIILITNVNLHFKSSFEKFCQKHNYALNTTARAIKFIKTVCRHARMNGLQTHHQLDDLKGKYQKVEHIHLSFDDLKKIKKVENLPEYLDNARDWLVISCFTGQRISDFMRFKKNMIRRENGKQLIEFTQVKTGKIMTVPLSKEVIAILEKRNGEFPRPISDQKYNKYIKDVCKVAKLKEKINGSRMNPESNRKEGGVFEKWELVASHIGRRSFATNHYGDIPTSLLIHATGHSSEQQFLAYIGKTDTQKAMQLAEYF